MKENEDENSWMYVLILIFCILSILTASLIILIFIRFKQVRSWAFELVLYLILSALINSTSYLYLFINNDSEEIDYSMCKFQGFIMIWSEFSEFIWALLIGFSVYENLNNISISKKSKLKRLKYILIGYVFPISAALIAYFCDLLGRSGKWCWINSVNSTYSQKAFAIILYVIYWILIISNLILTIVVGKQLKSMCINLPEKEKITKTFWKLVRYPIIQIICIIPCTLNRFLQLISGYINIELEIANIVFVSGQGMAYSIAYGYNDQVLIAIYNLITCKKCSADLDESDEYSDISRSLDSITRERFRTTTNSFLYT